MQYHVSPETIWLILGVLGVIAEVLTGGFWMLFAGLGALLTAAGTWLGLPGGLNGEILFFVATATLLALFLRRPLLARFNKHPPSAAIGDPAGKTVVVVKDLPRGGPGAVEFQGSPWEAQAVNALDSFPAGSRVKIIRQEGLRLWVEKAD